VRQRVFLKLLLLLILVVGASTATLDLLVRGSWEGSLQSQLQEDLEDKVRMFAARANRETSTIPRPSDDYVIRSHPRLATVSAATQADSLRAS